MLLSTVEAIGFTAVAAEIRWWTRPALVLEPVITRPLGESLCFFALLIRIKNKCSVSGLEASISVVDCDSWESDGAVVPWDSRILLARAGGRTTGKLQSIVCESQELHLRRKPLASLLWALFESRSVLATFRFNFNLQWTWFLCLMELDWNQEMGCAEGRSLGYNLSENHSRCVKQGGTILAENGRFVCSQQSAVVASPFYIRLYMTLP